MGDYSGALSIYADGSPDAQAAWQGVLDPSEVADALDLNALRVLELGTVYDNGNGG